MHDFTPTDHVPPTITPRGLADYLEVITHPVFAAGLATQVVDSKWSGFHDAFEGFDPRAVASFEESDIERLLDDQRIIRSDDKIRATVANARTLLEIDADNNGFAGWLHSFDRYDEVAEALKDRFEWVGDFGGYWIMSVLDEPRPPWEAWSAEHE